MTSEIQTRNSAPPFLLANPYHLAPFLLSRSSFYIPNALVFLRSAPHPTLKMTTSESKFMPSNDIFKFNQGQTNSVRVENISPRGSSRFTCASEVIFNMMSTATINEVVALFNTLIGDHRRFNIWNVCLHIVKGDVKGSQDYKASLGVNLEIAFFNRDAATFSLSYFEIPIDVYLLSLCHTEKRCVCPDMLSKAKHCAYTSRIRHICAYMHLFAHLLSTSHRLIY